jgi:hypothetical protein
MKCNFLWRSLRPLCAGTAVGFAFGIMSGSGGALGAETAYSALKVAAARVGRDSQNRVLEVRGRSGIPQPAIWQITIENPQSRIGDGQQLDVRSGKIASLRPMHLSLPRLSLNQIQIDSDGVFSIVNAEGIRSGVGFDRIDYVLSVDPVLGRPVWGVDLLDGPLRKVGHLKIAGDTAQVLERSPELALTEAQKRAARWSKPGEPYRSVPDFFHRFGKRAEKTGWQLKNWANGYGWTADPNPPPPNVR